ncbi:prenyltransferase [Luteimicrobium subarcticum]|uniref:4-hydroxybenzoate polyprenyltransferase n=1 Tax=Luteimicrobium subarcticum TaxID=620910 RepID=A0A2M8WTK1_9MICO|nr:prenyltransferase [Luteimicrobium subarcticum]PJI94186.1 4-hydroxybenzoate polyprenyltransferase [Luteimicrobium subarcticum]
MTTAATPSSTRTRTVATALTLLRASRPLSWIDTAFPFAAAVLLAAHHHGISLAPFVVVGTLFFLVPYNLLMYGVNDVFDHESDLRNPRKGGVEGALVDRSALRTLLWWSVGLPVPFVVAMLVLVARENPARAGWTALALVVVLFAVVAYSAPGLRFKERPFLDSATSSSHFVGPCVVGLVAGGAAADRTTVAVVVAFFCWGVAAQAFGAVQDVVPDREAGIASVATVLGARRTVRFALALWALAGVVVLAAGLPAAFAAVLVVPYLVLAWPYRSVTDDASAAANRGWRTFLWVNYACGFVVFWLCVAGWSAG